MRRSKSSLASFLPLTVIVLVAVPFLPASEEPPGDGEFDPLEGLQDIDDLGELEGLEEFDALIEELTAEMQLPTWDFSGGVEAAFGYSDNVELSAFFAKSSSFIRGGADLMVFRYPDGGLGWTNYIDTSYTYYLSDEVEDASFVLASTEANWEPRATTRYSAALRYLYQNEVIDASSIDSPSIGTTKTVVSSFGFEPDMRWDFAENWAAVVDFGIRYDDYRDFDDLVDYEGALKIERGTKRFGVFSLAYRHVYRDYMDREQSDGGGHPIPGTTLAVNQDSLEFRHTIEGGENLKWRVRTRFATMQNRDNSPDSARAVDNSAGWYDYDRHFALLSLKLQGNLWAVNVDGGYRDYKYLRQRGYDFGPNPALRRRDEWSAYARLERNLSESMIVFADAEYVDSHSNDPFLEYDQWRGAIGIRWSR